MRIEIERKFLLEKAVWENGHFPSAAIRQGYFS